MAYSVITPFVSLEQPTLAKWNAILANQVAFNDGTGVTGVWGTWTPTLANLTLGNGTSNGHYNTIGKTVYCYWEFTLGTTSAVGTNPTITLPTTPKSSTYTNDASGGSLMGPTNFYDVSATRHYPGGIGRLVAAATVLLTCATASGTFLDTANAVASTQPFTFATGDKIMFHSTYETT